MKRTRVGTWAAVALLSAFCGGSSVPDSPPLALEFAEKDLRALLPPDGQLVARGEISKDYVGIAMGRRVRANCKKVFVSDEKVGTQGVIFRDGHIELNFGAHVEKEVQVGPFKPTGAVDAAVAALLVALTTSRR